MYAYDMALTDYWRVIRKRRAVILITFLFVVFSTVLFTKLQIPIYQANTEIKIETKKTGGNTAMSPWGISTDLATEVQVITSLPVMMKAVEKLEVLPADPVERQQALYQTALKYKDKVKAKQKENTNLLGISVESEDPQKAALMANAIADIYIEEDVEGRRKQARAVLEYANSQLKKDKKKLDEEESRLQLMQQNERVFLITPEKQSVLARMNMERTSAFEDRMAENKTKIEELDRIILENRKNELMGSFISGRIEEDTMVIGQKLRLTEEEFNKDLLLIDYTEKHPLVVEQERIVREVRVRLAAAIKKVTRASPAAAGIDGISLVAERIALEIEREVLYRIINKFYGGSEFLSPQQREFKDLERTVKNSTAAYEALINNREEAKLTIAKEVADVSVILPAMPPRSPIKPLEKLNYLVGTVMGIIFGVLMGFMAESIDTSIGAIEDVEKLLGIPVLGIIPPMGLEPDALTRIRAVAKEERPFAVQRERISAILDPVSREAESLKALRTNLIQMKKADDHRTVLFTSSVKGEGKSTVVISLAISVAQLGKKTVLVGANLRRPSFFKIFGIEREPGLTDILIGKYKWENVVKTSTDIMVGAFETDKLLKVPGIDNLSLITAGSVVPNPSEILNSGETDKLLAELKKNFDIVIIDCSPSLPVSDAITLASKVDGVMLVYQSGKAGRQVLQRAKVHLENANASIWGVVLNNVREESQAGPAVSYQKYYGETPERDKSLFQRYLGFLKRFIKSQK